MLRQIPPLEAVEAFLAAARSRSFRAAAESLALSPSAFSRRIQLLERFLKSAMFERGETGTFLTPSGERYLAEIAPALESILRATVALRGTPGEHHLRLATSHSFAAEWLIPRLPMLTKTHGIEIALTVSRDPALLRTGEVELAVWGGPLAGLAAADIVAPLDAVPVSAPQLADGRNPPRSLAGLADHRLLAVKGSIGLWPDFLRSAGFTECAPSLVTYDTNQLKFEAAVSGVGIALAAPLLSERFISNGRLIGCISLRRPTGHGYALFSAGPRVRARPAARDFIAWLRREMELSQALFDRWYTAIC